VEFLPILGILFSGENRIMIRRSTMAIWEREHPPGPRVDQANRKFPLEDLHWNNNDPDDRGKMGLEEHDHQRN
jgi:hypothetical protein